MGRSLNPAPGSPRPMQRGTGTLAAATTSVDITVSAVDPLKAALFVNGYYGVTASTTPNDLALQWEIINATTIRFSRPVAGGASPALNIKWELHSWN
ncbi:hypothetical protein [Roseateles asaccharophilus]|uniref:Uncharacterized protein n=1 Tax=Roseateles asaccharophilus TaxID=582607 RepID=A0ABU2A3L1_9BURK|nr:hypothetical protein [Roseateles asaccharophilus]MDR7331772.1 hypothetical protein [Roseateles asaccharophilus]